MASNTNPAATFAGLPSFPEDVATAPLLRLSLKKLAERDEVEIQRLNAACEDLGFFYLDLQEASLVPDILDDVDELFHLGFRLFELPLEEKQKYDLSSQKSYFGYKAQGAAVVDRQGNLDRNEFYNVSFFLLIFVRKHTHKDLIRFRKTISWAFRSPYQLRMSSGTTARPSCPS
jgi:hypothetical protein